MIKIRIKTLEKGSLTPLLIGVIIVIAILLTGFIQSPRLTPLPAQDKNLILVTPSQAPQGKDNLQLETFGFITVTPSPKPTFPQPPGDKKLCPVDSPKLPDCGCTGGEPEWPVCPAKDPADCQNQGGMWWPVPEDTTKNCLFSVGLPKHQEKMTDPNCTIYCVAKPVLYLYPPSATFVDVKLRIPGKVVISDPLYPEEGWKQVKAYPDGSLLYLGKSYRELYYETEVDTVNPPTNGISIPTPFLKQSLSFTLTRLGLTDFEKQEFLTYWLPRLYDLRSPYILFSLIDPIEKERIDHIDVSPTPHTRIELLAYFKPLSQPADISVLKLPDTPPQRIGFTMVEWGGTLDY